MSPNYLEALNGNLKSPEVQTPRLREYLFVNKLDLHLSIWWIDSNSGCNFLDKRIDPTSATYVKLIPDQFYVLRSLSDSFIGLIKPTIESNKLVIDPDTLVKPNELESILPTSGEGFLIPPNSPRVCVGGGAVLGKGNDGKVKTNYIIRTQNWCLMPGSMSVPPKSTVTFAHRTVTGIKTTSSRLETFSASVSVSASASYGVASASVSSSISKSSTTFNQLETSTTDERSSSIVIENKDAEALGFLSWQTLDSITVYDGTSLEPVSNLETYMSPPIITPLKNVTPRVSASPILKATSKIASKSAALELLQAT